jgi:hypothetical protein
MDTYGIRPYHNNQNQDSGRGMVGTKSGRGMLLRYVVVVMVLSSHMFPKNVVLCCGSGGLVVAHVLSSRVG